MNSKTNIPTLLFAAIMAFALVVSAPSAAVYASGELDDEEEEQAITELQGQIELLNEQVSNNLNNSENSASTSNNETSMLEGCPIPEPEPEPVAPTCPLLVAPLPEPEPEPEPEVKSCPVLPEEQSIIPPFVEPEQNVTEPVAPVEENKTAPIDPVVEQLKEILENMTAPVAPVEQNVTAEEPPVANQTQLEPIICPVTGEILGYKEVPVEQNATEIEAPIPEVEAAPAEEPVQNATQDKCICISIDSETGQITIKDKAEELAPAGNETSSKPILEQAEPFA